MNLSLSTPVHQKSTAGVAGLMDGSLNDGRRAVVFLVNGLVGLGLVFWDVNK